MVVDTLDTLTVLVVEQHGAVSHSVASMVAALSLPAAAALLERPWPVTVFGAAAAVGVVFLHRGNIRRLRAGTEQRMSLRRRTPAAP